MLLMSSAALAVAAVAAREEGEAPLLDFVRIPPLFQGLVVDKTPEKSVGETRDMTVHRGVA